MFDILTASAVSYGSSGAEVPFSLVLFAVLLSVAVYVVQAYFLSRVFVKTGSPAWMAWVPFVNTWRMLELGGFHGALILLAFIPFIGGLALAVVMIMAIHRINIGFSKSVGWTVLGVLLPTVWTIALAVGSAQWRGGVRREGAEPAAHGYIAPMAQQSQSPQPHQPGATRSTFLDPSANDVGPRI